MSPSSAPARSAPAPAIEARALTRVFAGRAVVDRLDLAIPAGSIFGLLGPNGAGKTTTIGMFTGMLAPSAGEARVAGLSPVNDRDRLKRAIGYMPQSFALYDYLTARENLELYADLYLEGRKAARDRVREVVALVELEPYADVRAAKLSGGWRQRLALACAILHRPQILFLDEPTAGVDPVSRRTFWDLLRRINAEAVTIFMTTHYMEEVERCHEVGLIERGRLRTVGSPRELKQAVAAEHDLVLVVTTAPEEAFEALRGAPDLVDAYLYGDSIHLAFAHGVDGVSRARNALARAGLVAERIEPRPSMMEDVFVAATATAAAGA